MTAKEPSYNAEFFSKLLHITPRHVRRLAQDGVIPKNGRGEYPLLKTVSAYVAYLQEGIGNNGGGDTNKLLREEKIKLTRAQREKIDIEIDSMTAQLIPSDEYYLALSTTLKTVVATLASLGDILEREMQLPPECLIRIEEITDSLREQLSEQIKDVDIPEIS